MNGDRIVHWLANRVLSLASKEYRLRLRTVVELGKEALRDETIFEQLLDRVVKRGVR